MKAKVTVYPRPEILDPQGKAIEQTLRNVGFEAVAKVRAGKSFEVELDVAGAEEARALLDELCRNHLANTVVEDYSYELQSEEAK